MVTSPYSFGNQFAGNLGILGPTRMEYAKAIPLVEYVARVFQGILNQN
jgi:transcriptional regulator of heat shock response